MRIDVVAVVVAVVVVVVAAAAAAAAALARLICLLVCTTKVIIKTKIEQLEGPEYVTTLATCHGETSLKTQP